MGFRCGIVGLPNVGKSTLFNALTGAAAAAENYPFCTIDPNIGDIPVPDPRLDRLSAIVQPQRTLPAQVRFVDIAGLVKNANQGEGLGNRFLAHIRETQAIAHVVRCFADGDVQHVSGRVNPEQDAEIIHTELCMADLDTVQRATDKLRRRSRAGEKGVREIMKVLERAMQSLDRGVALRRLELREEERVPLEELQLITLKPMFYVANGDEQALQDETLYAPVARRAAEEQTEVVPICAAAEAELTELGPEERREFLESMGVKDSGLHRLAGTGYRVLGLQTFFTAGPKEVRAWTIPRGATALQAAAVIHTDFARGFIRAEVISYRDYLAQGGEAPARAAGKLRQEGRDYPMQDGDIVLFRFNI